MFPYYYILENVYFHVIIVMLLQDIIVYSINYIAFNFSFVYKILPQIYIISIMIIIMISILWNRSVAWTQASYTCNKAGGRLLGLHDMMERYNDIYSFHVRNIKSKTPLKYGSVIFIGLSYFKNQQLQ